jgi:ubiquinone/menaquinone biosynthesis C-methylase UbiE
VSCGDDNIIHQLASNKEAIVVANDISWSQVQLLKLHAPNIICTNHNASHLPFKDKAFDVALCKNTLHHMPHRKHLLSMLQSMKRIAKKIIIVEIENPNQTGGFAKFLHNNRYR